jgi:hypothetical protein
MGICLCRSYRYAITPYYKGPFFCWVNIFAQLRLIPKVIFSAHISRINIRCLVGILHDRKREAEVLSLGCSFTHSPKGPSLRKSFIKYLRSVSFQTQQHPNRVFRLKAHMSIATTYEPISLEARWFCFLNGSKFICA